MGDGRFSRIEQMIGRDGMDRLRAARAVVVGLGAVGSYATEALARAGVGGLRLVDFDTVHESNINRQLLALTSTIGRPKVEVAAARVRDINPACEVEALPLFAHAETMDRILAGPPNVLLDAIDGLNPKAELVSAALTRGVPVCSSMGAALRTDPTRVRTGWLTSATGCPLARRLRKAIRRRGLSTDDVLCVYSDEPVDSSLLREPDEDDAAAARGRSRLVLASLPTLTGVFGLTLANLALEILLGDLFPRRTG